MWLWHFAASSNIFLVTSVPNLVTLTRPSLTRHWAKLRRGISDFRISECQSLIEENYHNSRTSNDNDMKLAPVTKLDKRNKTTFKEFDDDTMLANCDVIVIFSIYGQFRAIRKPDSGRRSCKTCILIKRNLFS